MDHVVEWERSNRLQLNATNTEALWSTTIHRLHQLRQSLLHVGADLVAPSAIVRKLGIFIDADVSMRSHVMRLGHHHVRHSAKTTLYPTISAENSSSVADVVLSRLNHSNATLSGISGHLVQRLQSMMNVAARMIYSTSRFSHISQFLHQLHWLKVRDWIDYKLTLTITFAP